MLLATAVSEQYVTWLNYLTPLVFIGGWITALVSILSTVLPSTAAGGAAAGTAAGATAAGLSTAGTVGAATGAGLGAAGGAGLGAAGGAGLGAAGAGATGGTVGAATGAAAGGAGTGAAGAGAAGAAGAGGVGTTGASSLGGGIGGLINGELTLQNVIGGLSQLNSAANIAKSGVEGDYAGMGIGLGTSALGAGLGAIPTGPAVDATGAALQGTGQEIAAQTAEQATQQALEQAAPAAANPAMDAAATTGFPSEAFVDDLAGSVSGVPDVSTLNPEQAAGLGGAGSGAEIAESLQPGAGKLGAEIGGAEGMQVGGPAGQKVLESGGSPQQAAATAKQAGSDAGRIKTAAELGPKVGDSYGFSSMDNQTLPIDSATQNQADLLPGTGPGGGLEPGLFDDQGMLGSENIGKFLDGANDVNKLLGVAGGSMELAGANDPAAPPPMPMAPMPRRQAAPIPIPGGPMMGGPMGMPMARPTGGVRPLPITGF